MFHSPAGVRRTLAAALAVASCSAVGFAAQTAAPPYRVGWGDAASITAAATIALLGARTTPPLSTGAPCDRADLPGIDRRTVDLRSGFARSASDVALVGVTGGATRNSLLLLGGATGVGALRVIGGKHFPTDVLAQGPRSAPRLGGLSRGSTPRPRDFLIGGA